MALVDLKEVKAGIWELVLNRPEKHNALSSEMLADMISALRSAENKGPGLRALIISSSNEKSFCAGADLSERLKMKADDVPAALDKIRQVVDAVEAFPVPTIAVMEGIAFGGGLELALACDIRVASPRSQMGLTETRLAIIPGAGGTQRLARTLGPALAREWIFTAKRAIGAEALAVGLVNYCEDNPREKALVLADEISKAGPLALRAAKKAIHGGWNLAMPAALDWERRCYLETLHTQDREEGLKAFAEKRNPEYQGK